MDKRKSIIDEFDIYDDYVDEVLCGGGHITECLSQEEFDRFKIRKKLWELRGKTKWKKK